MIFFQVANRIQALCAIETIAYTIVLVNPFPPVVTHSKITKGVVLTSLHVGGKELRRKMGRSIGPVNPFPPTAEALP